MRWFFAALAALSGVLFMAACGDGEPQDEEVTPEAYSVVVATGDLAVGPQRLSFVLLKGDEPVSEPLVYVRFFKIPTSGSPELVGESPLPWSDLGAEEEPHGDSSHADTELRGVYFANLPFDEAGTWGIGVSPGPIYDEKSEARVQFDVKSKTQALAVGEKGLAATNGTSRDTPLKQIHTGSLKDDGFHDLSINEALASGRPSVLVFATPSFCQTRTCGPSLQVAVKAAPNYSGKVNFLHIEPYELDANGNLVTRADGFGKLAKTAETWRLPSEPWVFVLDKSGMVVSRFEGPYALEELTYILDQVSK